MLEEIDDGDEYDEYYEEVLSVYDTGLSTILEGDDESCSSRESEPPFRRHDPLRSSSHHGRHSVNLSPGSTSSRRSWGSVPRAPPLHLLSPSLFSPMAEARKMSSMKSPLIGLRSKTGLSPKSPPLIANLPLVLTNLETGEELLVDEDDEEFTFVSCSDAGSVLNSSLSGFDELALDSATGLSGAFYHMPPGSLTTSSSKFAPARQEVKNILEQRRRRQQENKDVGFHPLHTS